MPAPSVSTVKSFKTIQAAPGDKVDVSSHSRQSAQIESSIGSVVAWIRGTLISLTTAAIIGVGSALDFSTESSAGVFSFGPNFAIDEATGHIGMRAGGNPHFYEGVTLEDVNVLMQAGGEVGFIMKRIGAYTLYTNPAFSVGRMFEDTGVTNEFEWRIMFYADGVAEQPVLEVESSGTIASIRRSTLGSHWECWYHNGDTYPAARLNSSPRMGLEVGDTVTPGVAQTDLALRRTTSAGWRAENMAGDQCRSIERNLRHQAFTADHVLALTESDKRCSNLGAGGNIVLTLPKASDVFAGEAFVTHVAVLAAHNIRVLCVNGEQIRLTGTLGAANSHLDSSTVGDSFSVMSTGAAWVVTNYLGTGLLVT